jgi:hypothetical protein
MFNCEKCGKEILDGDDDYFQGCQHYQVVQLMLNANRGKPRRNIEPYVKPIFADVLKPPSTLIMINGEIKELIR